MLELKSINKTYKTGEFKQHALKDVSLKFRTNEFVAILGPSGSGKTTLLNIIGGLDRYDKGDLIINNKSTKKFKDKDWDAYRNHCIGFIFQSYNLIPHMNILKNVEMGMTLSGLSAKQRRMKAIKVLKRVGLEEHMYKKPNQLSGGQMQRVAIARALSNDPEIILADEPTGALDTKTSIQIMDLIKEIAKDKLVIMVTHNPELAENYANRIIKMQDGTILSDTNPVANNETSEIYNYKGTKMNFVTALQLSLNNLKTKKGRTFITSFASSIGIIGIALILSLSNGFNEQINEFERNTSDAMPIIISEQKINLTEEAISNAVSTDKENEFTDEQKITIYKNEISSDETNKIDEEYMNYLAGIPSEYYSSVSLNYGINYNVIQKKDNKYRLVSNATDVIANIPVKSMNSNEFSPFMTNYYEVLKGRMPENKNEAILLIFEDNRITETTKEVLGISGDDISFEETLNSNFKIVLNNDLFTNINDYFIMNEVNEKLYNNENNITVNIVGILRMKKEHKNMMSRSGSGIFITEELQQYILNNSLESDIVKKQTDANYNVLTGEMFDTTSKNGLLLKSTILGALGGKKYPNLIYIYPKNFDEKESLVEYLRKYNDNKKEDQVIFIDQASLITSVSGSIMDGITIVLIAFSSISLVVSSIMIGIIMYISVLERTKEIGILRSLGARKKDISRVFNAETFLIGLFSGLLGIFIAWILTFPTNVLLKNLTDLDNVAKMNIIHLLILLIISITLTLIGGSIPSKMASKKDPVIALRTE